MIAHFSHNFFCSFCTAFVLLSLHPRPVTTREQKENHENGNKMFPHEKFRLFTTERTWNWFWLYRWFLFYHFRMNDGEKNLSKNILRAFSMEKEIFFVSYGTQQRWKALSSTDSNRRMKSYVEIFEMCSQFSGDNFISDVTVLREWRACSCFAREKMKDSER